MISIKIFKQGNDLVIGACDEGLLGKKFIDGKLQIDVSKSFYGGNRIDKKTLDKGFCLSNTYLQGNTPLGVLHI